MPPQEADALLLAAPRRPRTHRWLVAIAAVLLMAFAVVGWVQHRQLALLSGSVQYNSDNIVWSFYQLHSEYLLLRDQLREAARHPDRLDGEALQQRYDIFVSRLLLVAPQRTAVVMPVAPLQTRTLARLDEFVQQADRLLGPQPERPFTAADVPALLAGLEPLATELHELSLWATVQVADLVGNRNQAVREQNHMAIGLTIFQGLLTLAFAAVVVHQLRALADRGQALQGLAARWREARREAEAASSAKSSFLANMSHEIRTPLTSIIGFADLLLDPAQDEAERAEAVHTIRRNGEHLLQVINDILDLSKIETGKLELALGPVHLPTLLREVATLVMPRARHKGLAFELHAEAPLPLLVHGDALRLKQILLNLCGNAVKFTHEGSVTLALRLHEPGGTLQFVVTDTGIGMTPAQCGRLFQPFTQADASITRRFGGTGLGLSLSSQLAASLGGSIAASSQWGVGSRFELSLPVSREALRAAAPWPPGWLAAGTAADGEAEAAPPSVVARLQGRVLLAEDGSDNQRLIGAYLRRAGLQAEVVGDGEQAVRAALAGRFDLVLMDIQMPVLDGAAALTRLRSGGYRGPVVALTANVMASDVQHYLALGFDDVLAKPLQLHRFHAVLAQRLARAAPAAEDEGFAQEMAQLAALFRQGLPQQLAAIEQAAAQANWPALAGLVHTLKGTAGSFGFGQLTAPCLALEQLLRRTTPVPQQAQAVAQVRRLLQIAREGLAEAAVAVNPPADQPANQPAGAPAQVHA
ncbi:hybrid sensor histidine kinase/response regulator [Aquincola tertiaricarbonis]|uniref:hybrid sensor histidine kinase/response regulator n=1 Tax=Aquincola tertiaricarbonis TaxID=391953 RepID=UPI000695ADFF|nr:ATP-binding protein [Aquincola tertiaricarbonis]